MLFLHTIVTFPGYNGWDGHFPKGGTTLDILHSLYDIVSGLGSFLLIPVFFFLLGLASRAGV